MSFSVAFCLQKDFENEQGIKLIESLNKNTFVSDIFCLVPEEDMEYIEKIIPIRNVTVVESSNPVPEVASCHKIPAFKFGDHDYQIFLDTSAVVRDTIHPFLEKMRADIWANPQDLVGGEEKDLRRISKALGIPFPKRDVSLRTNQIIGLKTDSIIVLNNVEGFSREWASIARKIFSEFDLSNTYQLVSISFTLTIEDLGLTCSRLPAEFGTSGQFAEHDTNIPKEELVIDVYN